MSRKAAPIVLNGEEKEILESISNSRIAPYRKVQRARLILLAAEGMTNTAIAQEVRLQRSMIVQWRQRFFGERLVGLEDRPRSGKPRQYTDADRLRVIETACNQKPVGETHGSVRTLAKATGVGRDTVHRILRQTNLQPHLAGTFSVSNDPAFTAKVVDVVRLYMHPPENAVVLCVDEKT